MISGLHHYALEVPDLEVAEGFLHDFGLETGEKDGSLVAQCPGRAQEQIRLVQAPAKRLHHVSFTLQPGHHSTRSARPGPGRHTSHRAAARRHRGRAVDPRPGRHRRATTRRGPGAGPARRRGAVQRGRQPAADRRGPVAAGHRGRAPPPAGPHPAVHRAAAGDDRLLHPGARPAGQRPHPRPGHLPERRPGDHHIFGFIASSHRGLPPRQLRGAVYRRDRDRGRPDAGPGPRAGWGLGRHTIGSNFFHYNPDPWGSWIEWFSDIDQIDDCWVASDWEVPPHLWGTPPPETFLAQQGTRGLSPDVIAEFRRTAYSSNCIHFRPDGTRWPLRRSPDPPAGSARRPSTRESIMSRDVTQIFADIDAFDPDKFVAHLTPTRPSASATPTRSPVARQ